MKKIVCILTITGFIGLASAQSNNLLKQQVSFCSQVVQGQEKEIHDLQYVLEIQDSVIIALKKELVKKESDKINLNEKIVDLESASLVLSQVATRLEAQNKLIEAHDIYKLITEIYPGTIASSTAHSHIRKIHTILRNRTTKK